MTILQVLKYKGMAEEYLRHSSLPYTILRPGRLTDGPYTSYDLNTLLKGVSGNRQNVTLSRRDDLSGEASRIAVAEAIVQSLMADEMTDKVFSLTSTEGDGPGQDAAAWKELFKQIT